MVVASLVLGIIAASFGVFCFWFPVVGQLVPLATGIIAICLSVVGKKKQPEKKNMATAGLVLGIIGTALGVIMTIVWILGVSLFPWGEWGDYFRQYKHF